MRGKIYQIIETDIGETTGARIYNRVMMFCIVASILPLCFKQSYSAFVWVERITAAVFILDYILRWLTADMKYAGNRALAFIRYPVGLFAIIDLLSILPTLTVLHEGFKLFRLLRLAKAFKVLRILRYSKSVRIIVGVIRRERHSLMAAGTLAVGYIFLTALVMFQVEPESFETFFDAVYWAMVTLTTVGYGDIYPVSDIGRVFSMLSSFVGIAIVALPTGIITAGYTSVLNEENHKSDDKTDDKIE